MLFNRSHNEPELMNKSLPWENKAENPRRRRLRGIRVILFLSSGLYNATNSLTGGAGEINGINYV